MQANRADDPDSCLQYTVNAVSGERQAPPKTLDGGDTEEVDASLAMVYVRIHTGSSLPFNPALKTGELEALTESAAAEGGAAAEPAAAQEEASPRASSPGQAAATAPTPAEDAAGTVAAAAAAPPPAADEGTGEAPAAASVAATATGPAQQGEWDQVYSDVLQKIYSCR